MGWASALSLQCDVPVASVGGMLSRKEKEKDEERKRVTEEGTELRLCAGGLAGCIRHVTAPTGAFCEWHLPIMASGCACA
jgi:hypothetical protein